MLFLEALLDRLAVLSLDGNLHRVAFALELNRDCRVLVHFHFLSRVVPARRREPLVLFLGGQLVAVGFDEGSDRVSVIEDRLDLLAVEAEGETLQTVDAEVTLFADLEAHAALALGGKSRLKLCELLGKSLVLSHHSLERHAIVLGHFHVLSISRGFAAQPLRGALEGICFPVTSIWHSSTRLSNRRAIPAI